jgi:phosphoribosylglycinamide formyltransferase 1
VRLGVLASGSGTNLEAIIEAGLRPVVVVVDRPCRATEVAAGAGVPAEIVGRDSFGAAFDRVAYTHRVVDVLAAHDAELVAMAGFGTILEKPIFDAYAGRILNTHPALLPAFPGAHAIRDALAAGVDTTGVTVHWVDEGVDTGPVIAQVPVSVEPGDDENTLRARIQAAEKPLYIETIRQLCKEIE